VPGEVGRPNDTDGYDYGMTRAVVVGNGSGGKSTLARALAERDDRVWCSVDQIRNPQDELAYPTAWRDYTLLANKKAAAAFSGRHPELVSNVDWSESTVKN